MISTTAAHMDTAPNFLEDEDYSEEVTTPTSKEWKEKVAAGEVKGYEHPNKGKNPDSSSRKKRKPGAKYNRRDVTEADLNLLVFLERFKLATTLQTAILLGVSRSSASWRLNGLKEMGLIGQEKMAMMPVLWYIKPKGKVALDAAFIFDPLAPKNLHTPGNVSPALISHTLFENQVAAQIIGGANPLGKISAFDGFSKQEITQRLIDETFLRKAWGTATYRKGEGSKGQAQRGYEIAKAAAAAAERDRNWSTMIADNPSMWTLTVPLGQRNDSVKEFHYPDLVINLEENRVGKAPVSFAVELELTPKTPKELQRILNTFKVAMESSPVSVYRGVFYLVADEGVRRGVEAAIQAVGLTSNQIRVGLIKDFKGEIFSGKAWDL